MENSSELEKLNNEIKQTEVKELKSVIGEIHKEITSVENPKIPELIFKTQFADYFKNIENFDPSDPLVMKWLYIAGNAYSSVDLINSKAEVVDTVPPLYARPIISDKMESKNFDDIATTYQNKTNMLATVGKNYLLTALSDVAGMVDANVDPIASDWGRLLNKYSDKPIAVAQDNKPKLVKKVIPTDGFDYD